MCQKYEDPVLIVRARLLVPSATRAESSKALYDSAHSGGHLGQNRIVEKISKRFYWPRWRESSAITYYKECQLCERRKQPSKTPKVELVLNSELSPMLGIEIDILGRLPMTHTGTHYVLIACKRCAKCIQA